MSPELKELIVFVLCLFGSAYLVIHFLDWLLYGSVSGEITPGPKGTHADRQVNLHFIKEEKEQRQCLCDLLDSFPVLEPIKPEREMTMDEVTAELDRLIRTITEDELKPIYSEIDYTKANELEVI